MKARASSVLGPYPHQPTGDQRHRHSRAWWPRPRDLAAMVGLADTAGSGDSGPPSPGLDSAQQGGDVESATVFAAQLSQLLK